LMKGFTPPQIAATELHGNKRDGVIHFPNIRTKTLWGQVHDEKAWYSMGGVSGHAGLLSDTHDMAVLMQVMLNGGGYGNVKL
ncbi:penicillin binding protein PBP4B, partial [Salmonella enterica subsp. enterica serovar Weltevreden]|nr:penicillin binding protein PBP4B [Salmonella enterica subsp. enterica serovar Weltevreden]